MPPQSSKKTSSSSSLIWLLLLVVLGVAGYYFYTVYFATSSDITVIPQVDLPIGKTNWDTAVLQREEFSALANPIQMPFVSGPTGNTNPFIQVK